MSVLLFITVCIFLSAGYWFFGGYLTRLFALDQRRPTPAVLKNDGIDYVPAKNWLLLFGHHFASIAGAGPLLGPVLAYLYWGWFPALLWIILGSLFIGGLHDFSSLVVSLREGGVSIGQVAATYLSVRASKILLIFIWCALILVIAVFAAICAENFISQPHVVVPSLGLIPVAVIVGILIYRIQLHIIPATLLGIISLGLLIVACRSYPVVFSGVNPYLFWVSVLLFYAFVASIIPVNILLQPRDYLSCFLLFFGVAVGIVGIITRPFPITGSRFFQFQSSSGPLFPLMFITLACGAASGFHSLVSSGTTSKQLTREPDARKIGYGAMILEALLATIVLFSVAFGLKVVPGSSSDPTGVFARGFCVLAYFLGDYGEWIPLIILNAFILTTLDTATRIARLITEELFGISNKCLATLLVVGIAAYLVLMKKWVALWPVFGAANQLVAGLSLIVVSAWLFSRGKKYTIAFVPAIIMILITVTALIVKMIDFMRAGNYVLCVINSVLFVLGVYTLVEFRMVVRKKRR